MSQQRNNSALIQTSTSDVATFLIGGSFVTIFALTTPFITMQLKSSLPYMSTPKKKVEKALIFLSTRTKTTIENSCKSNNFVDLGSGDGTAVLAASSLGWRAVGIEMNPTLFLISSIRRLVHNQNIRTNSQLKFGDMFDESISRDRLQNADSVMIFGVQSLMPRIAKMIERDCQPGCFIMSYRFRLPIANVTKDSDEGTKTKKSGLHASLIYDEEEMRIYELHRDKTDEARLNNR